MEPDRYQELIDLMRKVRHDANNPLTAALGHVQLLIEDPAVQDEEVLSTLRLVESELRRLADILRKLKEIPGETAPASPTWPPIG